MTDSRKRLKRIYRDCPRCKKRFRTTSQGRTYCCRGCAIAAGSRMTMEQSMTPAETEAYLRQKALEESLPHWMKT